MQTEKHLQTGTISNEALNFVHSILEYGKTIDLKNELKCGQSDITIREFETYGFISYLFGLQFTQDELTTKNLDTIIKRLQQYNLDGDDIKRYFDYMNSVDVNRITEGKDIMSNLIVSDIKGYELKNSIKNILYNSLVPVNMSKELFEKFGADDNRQITYHDLLIFNNVYYENIISKPKSSLQFVELVQTEFYKKELHTASEFFELQKYALIFWENSLNVKDSLEKYAEDFIKDFVVLFATCDSVTEYEIKLNEFLVNHISVDEKENVENIVEVEDKNIIEYEIKSEITSEPELEIQNFLKEFDLALSAEGLNFDYINKTDDLIEMIESTLNDEDLAGPFYMYLKQIRKNQELNVTPEINLGNFLRYDNEQIIQAIKSKIKEYQDKYTTFNFKYLKEIESDEIKVLIEKVTNLISKLYIVDSTSKSVLFSQLTENIIFSYKHLHEILLLIEPQYINGSVMHNYVDIYNDLKENHSDVYEMFTTSNIVGELELKIKMLYAFKNILEPVKISEDKA